jgi:hypothetical protein
VKSFLNKKNRWYAGMFYFYSPKIYKYVYKYGYVLPMIGYRHLNNNCTFFGLFTLIIPELDDAILYSFLSLRCELGVPLNVKKNLFFYVEYSALFPLRFVPNFNINYERCFSRKLAYSINLGGFISPALGEKGERRGPMRGSVPVDHKILYGFSIKLNLRFI